VLGLNSQLGAQRLARLLLADPLGAEEQWEKELLKAGGGGGGGGERAVLLKYGPHAFDNWGATNSPVDMAKTPMPRLRRHCINP